MHRVALALGLGFTSLYLFTASIYAPQLGDGFHMLKVADRIATFGFDFRPKKPEAPVRANPGGFSKYGLGQSLIDLPVAWAFNIASKAQGVSRFYYTIVLSAYAAPSRKWGA